MKPSKRIRRIIEYNVQAQLYLRLKAAGLEDPVTVKIHEELEYTITFKPFDHHLTVDLEYDV